MCASPLEDVLIVSSTESIMAEWNVTEHFCSDYFALSDYCE